MGRGLFSVSNLVKQEEANKNVASLFLKRVEEAVVKLEKKRKPSNYYKPSSLVCLRQMYFVRQGIEPDDEALDSSFVGICQSGTDRHTRIQRVLKAMKRLKMEFEYIDIETYVKEKGLTDIKIVSKRGMETHCINTRYNLSFMTDGIIRYIPEDKYFIFECKTEVSFKFNNRDAHEMIHESQASCYSLSFGIDDTLFLYENRDLCNKKAYHVETSYDKQKALVIDKIKKCEKHLADKEVPPKLRNIDIDPNYKGNDDRIGGPSAKICQYCSYKGECSKWL